MLNRCFSSLCLVLLLAACVPDTNAAAQWRRVSADLKTGLPPFGSVEEINDFVNSYRYISDKDNYGVDDYWATPKEFFSRNGGDCEDFVIAKYALAREAGLANPANTHLEIVYDRRKKENHMILIINGRVLDNQNEEIVSVEQAHQARYDMLAEVRDGVVFETATAAGPGLEKLE